MSQPNSNLAELKAQMDVEFTSKRKLAEETAAEADLIGNIIKTKANELRQSEDGQKTLKMLGEQYWFLKRRAESILDELYTIGIKIEELDNAIEYFGK
jgi:hypothetical protein